MPFLISRKADMILGAVLGLVCPITIAYLGFHLLAGHDKVGGGYETMQPKKRRCAFCKRAVASKTLDGVVVLALHTPPGGGYCVGSEQPVQSKA